MAWDQLSKDLICKNGVLFAGPEISISYPSEANDAYYKLEDKSFWFKHRAKCIVEVVKNFPPEGMIFDIGGGNGHVSNALEKSGFQTVLVEPGVNGVFNAKNRGLKRLICASMESANFNKSSLPAIGIFDVLEHLKEDQLFLSSIREKLRSDGLLYVTVPAYQWLWSYQDEEGGHFRTTRMNLNRLLESNGFEVCYSTYIFVFLPLIIFLFRSLPYRFSLKNSRAIEKPDKDHIIQAGFVKSLLDGLSHFETRLVRERKVLWAGGTCLVVARLKKRG